MYLMAINVQLRSRNVLIHAQKIVQNISRNAALPPEIPALQVFLPPKINTDTTITRKVEKQCAGWFVSLDYDTKSGSCKDTKTLHKLYVAKYGDMSPSAWRRWQNARESTTQSMLQSVVHTEASGTPTVKTADIVQGICVYTMFEYNFIHVFEVVFDTFRSSKKKLVAGPQACDKDICAQTSGMYPSHQE